MNHSKFPSLTRSRLLALGLVFSGAFGLLAACSSDGGNAGPSNPPPISTGGGGDGGDGGEPSEPAGGAVNGGASNGGASNGGETNGGEAGEAGAAGGGGGPVVPECTLVGDLAFLNQPASGFNEKFDNKARLGTQTTLPALP
jgi:hypothetical protein